MLNPLDIPGIIKEFIPDHKQSEIRDHIIDMLTKACPNERSRKLLQSYRSDAAFKAALVTALKCAVEEFVRNYEDTELVEALTQSPRFWDTPSVQSALQKIITRPLSYLQQERHILLYSFSDVLSTIESQRVEAAVHFFLLCLTREVITIPQLAPMYQVQLQWASLEQSHQLVGLQRDQNQLITTLVETVTQNQPLLPSPAGPTLLRGHDNLPPQRGELLGREKESERVLKGLCSRWPLVSIEGMGGVGKTTLAIDIARSCLVGPQAVLDPPFEYAVWVSAKDQPEQKLWLNEVLDTTARILGYSSLMKLPLEEIEKKKAEVDQLLRTYRTLLVIDNFETIEDSALEAWMEDIPEPSKVLITSRTSQLRNTRSIDLKGLEDPAALALIRYSAGFLGLETLEAASEETLLPLVRVTDGNPKAIEMALGYIKRGRLGLTEVVDKLHIAGKTVNDVFNYLFDKAWNVMNKEAKHVILIFPFFADYASKEALRVTVGLSEYHLDNAVEELVVLKMLDIQESSVAVNQHYSIHPLTRAFASAELGKRPEFAKEARIRWSQYYLDLAKRSLVLEKPEGRYWDALPPYNRKLVDPEWLNLQEVLAWADQEGQDRILVELMVLLPPYMYGSMLFPARIDYARKAAEAACRLGQKEDAALLYIDACGWILLEVGRLTDAISVITTGLHIAQSLDASCTEVTNLIALAHAWLACAFLEQGDLVEASVLMDKVVPSECKPVIQYRVSFVAGDIAYKKNDIVNAIKLYKSTYHLSVSYKGELVDTRLGDAYFAYGDLVQAETCFNKVLDRQQDFGTHEIPYAKYGLARIALAKGEREKARQMAQEVLSDLARVGTSHRLSNDIHHFLEDLEF